MTFEDQILPLQPQLLSFCINLMRNSHDGEDLAQDVLTKAFRGYDAFDGKNAKAWLFTIARTLHIDRVRASARRPLELWEDDQQLSALAERSPSAEDLALMDPEQSQAWGVLATMRPEWRLVLLAKAYEVPLSTLARERGIPIGTIGTQLMRARKAAREQLAA